MDINKIIDTTIKKILTENVQLADKIYFNTGKLSEEIKKLILDITGGDNYTKLLADFYYYISKFGDFGFNKPQTKLEFLYDELKNYNKNVFPIESFDIYKPENIGNLINSLESRKKIIDNIKKLPSVATRNMKKDIREPRDFAEFKKYEEDLSYFMAHFDMLSNRDEKMQMKILQKMFKADTTLNDLMRFVDDKSNFIGGAEFTKEDVREMSEYEDFEIIYEQGNVMIVRVDSPDGIKAIGCNSVWCFTYGTGFDNAYRQWNNFSYNDIVYVLIDFNQKPDYEDFMHVIIKPLTDEEGDLIDYDDEDDYPIYNMANENYYDPYSILKSLFGDNYKKIINKYLNFEY